MCQALRDGCSDTHADERTRTVAECNHVETIKAGTEFAKHGSNHRQQQARVLAFLLGVPLDYAIVDLQRHAAGNRRRVQRQYFHALARRFSWRARKRATSSSELVDGIGSSVF
jgi:hypothetical protein